MLYTKRTKRSQFRHFLRVYSHSWYLDKTLRDRGWHETVRPIAAYVTSDAVGRVWIDLCSRLVAVLGRSLIDLRRKGKCLLADNECIRALQVFAQGKISHFISLYTCINIISMSWLYVR